MNLMSTRIRNIRMTKGFVALASRLWCFSVFAIFLLQISGVALAHTEQTEPAVVIVKPQKTYLSVTISGNGQDAVQAATGGDQPWADDEVPEDDQQKFLEYVHQKLILKQGGEELRAKIQTFEYWHPDKLDLTKSKYRVLLRYQRPENVASEKFQVVSNLFDYLPNAKTIISVGGYEAVLQSGQSKEFDPDAVAANLWNNIRDFTLMGVEHIFTGPDHMLFIVALLLVSTSFWSLVKTLTGFTIAHSITLVLSALSVIVLDNRIVDIFIAGSIIYVGLENIFWKGAEARRFWIAAAFGLIHGFGFSYTLRDMGLPEEGLVWCLLSFNIGVEIAQIAICAVAFPLLMVLKKRFDDSEKQGGTPWLKAMHAMSWCVVAAGAYWLAERLMG